MRFVTEKCGCVCLVPLFELEKFEGGNVALRYSYDYSFNVPDFLSVTKMSDEQLLLLLARLLPLLTLIILIATTAILCSNTVST